MVGPLGTDYQAVRARIDALVRPVAGDASERAVPATPGWSVHDVVAHLAGVTEDALAGRMDGAPGDAWTGAQAERGRGRPTVALLDEWAERATTFAGFLDPAREYRAVFDVTAHWIDLAGALGAEVDRNDRIIDEYTGVLVEGLEWVSVRTPSFERGAGSLTLTASAFEVMRSRFGRRSRAQVLGYDWSEDPSSVLDHWFIFGPASEDLVE